MPQQPVYLDQAQSPEQFQVLPASLSPEQFQSTQEQQPQIRQETPAQQIESQGSRAPELQQPVQIAPQRPAEETAAQPAAETAEPKLQREYAVNIYFMN